MKKTRAFFFGASLFALASAGPAYPSSAHGNEGLGNQPSPATAAAQSPLAALSIYQVGGKWIDDQGKPLGLPALRGRSVVIAMFFTRCGYACPLTVAAMQQILVALPAVVRAQTAFVLVSFDSEGDGPAELRDYRAKYRLDKAEWTLLNGPADDVRALAMVLGVSYAQTASGQFSHSNLISVLDPEGRIVFQAAPATAGLTASALAAIVH